MAGSAEEKREGARHQYGHPITYIGKVTTPGIPPQEVPFRGTIVDLSNGGIGIETTGQSFLEIGSLVRTWVPMPTIPVKLPVVTRVQWMRDNESGRNQLVGLKFLW